MSSSEDVHIEVHIKVWSGPFLSHTEKLYYDLIDPKFSLKELELALDTDRVQIRGSIITRPRTDGDPTPKPDELSAFRKVYGVDYEVGMDKPQIQAEKRSSYQIEYLLIDDYVSE